MQGTAGPANTVYASKQMHNGHSLACIGCRGNLILDCRDFNSSGVEQCFTKGSSEPKPCKPAASGTVYPRLTDALANGTVIDGDEGSLCVLNPGPGRTAPGNRSPYIPASAGGGGCNLGLNCLSLRVCYRPLSSSYYLTC